MSIGAGPRLLLLPDVIACSLLGDDAALWYPACNCRCCCSGPFVSLSSVAIVTASGSGVWLSCSYLAS